MFSNYFVTTSLFFYASCSEFLDCDNTPLDCNNTHVDCNNTYLDCNNTHLDFDNTHLDCNNTSRRDVALQRLSYYLQCF